MGLENWTVLYPDLYPRGGENMLNKLKQAPEETSVDLHEELDYAQALYEASVASLQERSDERRQVVRHRLAVLEAEALDLDELQTKLSS